MRLPDGWHLNSGRLPLPPGVRDLVDITDSEGNIGLGECLDELDANKAEAGMEADMDVDELPREDDQVEEQEATDLLRAIEWPDLVAAIEVSAVEAAQAPWSPWHAREARQAWAPAPAWPQAPAAPETPPPEQAHIYIDVDDDE